MRKGAISITGADKRALEFLRIIREIEQFPLVELKINRENVRQPIFLGDKSHPSAFRPCSVSDLLRMDLNKAKANGGTWSALLTSIRRPSPHLPQSEIDRATDAFLLDADE